MNGSHHWSRLTWLVGIAALVGSLVGANHVLNPKGTDVASAREPRGSTADKTGAVGGPGVVVYGTAGVEGYPDLLPLAPQQPGEVTEVHVYEGQTVHKGDVLLRVNEEPFLRKVAQAELGVQVAELKLTLAKRALDQYAEAVAAQEAVVKVAQAKLAGNEAQLRRIEKLIGLEQSNKDDLEAKRQEVAGYQAGVEGEEKKLKALQKGRPETEVELAAKNVEHSKQLLQEAKDELERCRLVAKCDGMVLRLNVGVGSLLTPQARQEAILLAPAGPRVIRAEVEQEFANRVTVGQPVTVLDDASTGLTWAGKVERVGEAYLRKRGQGPEALALSSDARPMLECVITLTPGSQAPPPKIGQRVRVNLGVPAGP
jgi:multidrug resistance efflux pump